MSNEEKRGIASIIRETLRTQEANQQRVLATVETMSGFFDQVWLQEFMLSVDKAFDGNKWLSVYPAIYSNAVQITGTFIVQRIADILPRLEEIENAFGDDLAWKHEDKAAGRSFTAEYRRDDLPFHFVITVDAVVEDGDGSCFRVIENVEVSHYESKTYKWICE